MLYLWSFIITLLLEPVTLIGEGKFNLNDVKEIKVTESYLGLSQDVRGCQNEETMEDCSTRYYRETILQQCGCLPYSIRSSKKVKHSRGEHTIIRNIFTMPRIQFVLLNRWNAFGVLEFKNLTVWIAVRVIWSPALKNLKWKRIWNIIFRMHWIPIEITRNGLNFHPALKVTTLHSIYFCILHCKSNFF